MSVTEICARMEPSMNSTSEWTVDCGWTVTRTFSAGRSKRRQASMTSKPLFIMVAESMVMRWPMTQVGCLRACAGVMWSKSASGRVAERAPGGGEPDLLDLGGGAAAHGLVDGVVLGVDGEEGDVAVAGGGDDEVAGGDEALLVGEADGLAGLDGGVGGFEAGDADDGGDDEVDVGVGGDGDGSGGAVDDFDVWLMPAARRRSAKGWRPAASVAREMSCGRQRLAWAKAASRLEPAARAIGV